MDLVWIVGLAWAALALPVALIVSHYLWRADLRDAQGPVSPTRDHTPTSDHTPRTDSAPTRPPPPAPVRPRPHRSHGRRRARLCPECRSAEVRRHRRSSGPPGIAESD